MTEEERSELVYAVYLLNAALEADHRRRWWQLPNCLWVGRTEHALSILLRLVEDSPAEKAIA